jgi:pyruvate ferredoxin oxidoreductase gamma subunit
MAIRYNIRMAGVGGQGVVTASHIFSTAVINAGGESTIVPFYGSEKRMAPVESYVRVSNEPIYEIGEITFPHILMIFHPQCITHGKSYTNPFYYGLKKGGVVLMNLEPDQAAELKDLNAKIYYLPATQMSLDVAGIDLATNMAMVGAIGAITGLTTLEACGTAVKDRFLGKGFVVSGGTAALDSVVERKFKKKAELIEKNLAVVKAAWDYAVENGWTLGASSMADQTTNAANKAAKAMA